MKLARYFLLIFVFMPIITLAQFTGYQDPTNSPVNWTTDTSIIQGQVDNIQKQDIKFGTEKNISTNRSINANNSDPANSNCTIAKKTLKGYVDYLGCQTRVVVLPFIFGLAVVSFVYGVVKMISNSSNEEAQTTGKTFILWGIIGFFVIISVYSLVAIIRRTVGFGFNAKDDSTPYLQLKDKVQKIN